MEDKIKVKCKANELGFTKENIYMANRTITGKFIVKNDEGTEHLVFLTDFFNLFEEVKEYSVMELFEENEGIKFKIEGLNYIYFVSNGILRRTIDGITAETLYLDKFILNKKFIKIEEPKPATTSEAFKALDEGKIIESYLGYNYKKINGYIKTECKGIWTFRNIGIGELEGQWIIKGDSEC